VAVDSGGTPYGIALAAHDPRVATLGIVSGDAPPGAVPEAPAGLPATVSGHPRLSRWVLRLVGLAARVAPGFTADRGTGMLVEADRLVVSEPRARRRFIAMLRDALRQGPEGTARDLELAARWWAVAPPARSVPIHLWHGEADVDSPPAIARYLQERLPGATLETFPGEGHVSAVIRHADAIVRTLGRDLVTAGP